MTTFTTQLPDPLYCTFLIELHVLFTCVAPFNYQTSVLASNRVQFLGSVCFLPLVVKTRECSCANETDGEWNLADPDPRGIAGERSDAWRAREAEAEFEPFSRAV